MSNQSIKSQLGGLLGKAAPAAPEPLTIDCGVIEPTTTQTATAAPMPELPGAPPIPAPVVAEAKPSVESDVFEAARRNLLEAARKFQEAAEALLKLDSSDLLGRAAIDRAKTSVYEILTLFPQFREQTAFEKLYGAAMETPAEYRAGDRTPRMGNEGITNYDAPPAIDYWGRR